MKIMVKRNEQSPDVTIDTKDLVSPSHFTHALATALELEGWTPSFVNEVFNYAFEPVKLESDETNLH